MIKGKIAVVTGGSRGIGESIAYKLASNGANVAIIYAGNEEAAERVCQNCKNQYGVEAKTYKCNVANFDEVKLIVAEIKKDFGYINILVNNAGITRDRLIAMMKEDDFDQVMDINLKGAFNMIKHTTPIFIRNGEGCIINISSVSGLMGNPGQSNYSASKAGLIGLTKSVAKELASKSIRCNAIAPGFIETDMTASQEENPLVKLIPLKRMGKPEDVAEAVEFLVNANYITGEILRVDGGIAI